MMCHHSIEAANVGNLPRAVGRQQSTEKEHRVGPTENSPPHTLSTAWDRKLIGILTGAALDCGPQPGGTSFAIRWSGGRTEE